MEIRKVVAGIYGANCYIVMDKNTKEAVVVDPGGDVEDIVKAIDTIGAKVKYILLTHGHVDHTSGVAELKSYHKAIVCISTKDDDLITNGEYLFGPLIKGGADKLLKAWGYNKNFKFRVYLYRYTGSYTWWNVLFNRKLCFHRRYSYLQVQLEEQILQEEILIL